jgi:hypothetical protein
MKENKTKPEKNSPEDFLKGIANPRRKADGLAMLKLMQDITKEKPVMWGSSIIGFGSYHYESARTGRGGEWMTVGFSPRASALTLYGLIHYDEGTESLAALGDVTTGKGCIYVKDLSQLDQDVLTQMIKSSFEQKNGKHLKL